MSEALKDEQIAIAAVESCYEDTAAKFDDLLKAAMAAVNLVRDQIAKQEPASPVETQEQPGQLAQEIDVLRREIETLIIQQGLMSARITALETSHNRLQEIVRLGNDGKSAKKRKRSKLLKKAITDLEIAREVPDDLVLIYVKWALEYLYEWQKIASTKKYNEDLRQNLAQSARPLPHDYRLKEAISCLQNAQKSKDIDICEHWVSAAIGWSLPILYSAEISEPQESQ